MTPHLLYSIAAGLVAALGCAWLWARWSWPAYDGVNLYELSPSQFESAVGDIFRSRGYQVENIRHSGDDGIDLLVARAGQKMAVQCKRYKQPIGPGFIREFVGAISLHGLQSGFFVTTSRFTGGAKRTARDSRYQIHLVDGQQLKTWQRRSGAGAHRFWLVRLAVLFDIGLIVSILAYLLGSS